MPMISTKFGTNPKIPAKSDRPKCIEINCNNPKIIN